MLAVFLAYGLESLCHADGSSMQVVVAVSGGVDSVVLLDMLVKNWQVAEGTRRQPSFSGKGKLWNSFPERSGGQNPPIIVAHFDHGIRDDSAEDAQFVASLAKKYRLPFETKREILGKNASEELARERRYLFLRQVARKYDARIATAHHMNDSAETIAINIARGTGWRGVAVLASAIYRPLLGMTKQELLTYAKENSLDWREDSTNASSAYLRNRLRAKIVDEDVVLQLAALRAEQVALRDQIDAEVAELIRSIHNDYSRYFFTHVDAVVARELLRGIAINEFGYSPTRPQLERVLLAIKTARPGSTFEFGDAWLTMGKKTFGLSVKTP